jgi:predicted nucleic acid-binding protein
MPETDRIVVNTGPLLALMAALGDLSLLDNLYTQIVVPREVEAEVLAGGKIGFGVETFSAASF